MKKKGKYAARRNMKPVVLMIAVVMLLGCAIGGTLAWLTDKTDVVTNTFTTSDINITLTESDTDLNTDGEQHDYKMIPGWTIEKDPKASVVAGSEDCYLFVKVEESANVVNFLSYGIASDWTELTSAAGSNYKVYYMVFDSQSTDADKPVVGQEYSIIGYTDTKGTEDTTDDEFISNKVLVKDTVTKEMMNGLTEANYPTLTFTAYATQLYKNNTEQFSAADAWAIAKPVSNG